MGQGSGRLLASIPRSSSSPPGHGREIILLLEAPRGQGGNPGRGLGLRRGGEDFAALAKEVSQAGTKDSGGLLGTIHKGDIASELEASAFSIPVGSVSPVIAMPHGFHVLKVDARIDEGVRPLEEVREKIRDKIAEQRYAKDLQAFLDKTWNEATIWVNPKYADRLDRRNGNPTPPA